MEQGRVRLDIEKKAVTIERLTIGDEHVAREAARWTRGIRGDVVTDPDIVANADLSAFATEAVVIGARALAATGQTVEARVVEEMLKEVSAKTADATSKAAEVTERAVMDASDAVVRATTDATKAIAEAESHQRKEFGDAVGTATRALTGEVRRIFGGDSPELLDRLQPLLEKFGTQLDENVRVRTTELIEKATQQFDASDPTSPMARHTAALAADQNRLAEQLHQSHAAITKRIEELAMMLKVKQARADLAKVTPIKGGTFEDQLSRILHSIGVALGEEYVDTRNTVGHLPRCKRGDGVLSMADGAVRVVIEASDSETPRNWTEYLDEAERNRDAAASLGIVRHRSQNAGKTVRVLGSRRIVMAFDPESEDPELLRTVVLLLRTAALAAVSRTGEAEIGTAEERIVQAIDELTRLDAIKKMSGAIQKSAMSINGECIKISNAVRRLLDEAMSALDGARASDKAHAASDTPGAA
jgi:hypothetical protein